jgi:hypothetical protein
MSCYALSCSVQAFCNLPCRLNDACNSDTMSASTEANPCKEDVTNNLFNTPTPKKVAIVSETNKLLINRFIASHQILQ